MAEQFKLCHRRDIDRLFSAENILKYLGNRQLAIQIINDRVGIEGIHE